MTLPASRDIIVNDLIIARHKILALPLHKGEK